MCSYDKHSALFDCCALSDQRHDINFHKQVVQFAQTLADISSMARVTGLRLSSKSPSLWICAGCNFAAACFFTIDTGGCECRAAVS